jgi:hypothetical protein
MESSLVNSSGNHLEDARDDALIEEIVDRIRDPDTGVPVKDRFWYLRTYPKCFVGNHKCSVDDYPF